MEILFAVGLGPLVFSPAVVLLGIHLGELIARRRR